MPVVGAVHSIRSGHRRTMTDLKIRIDEIY
jgi:hypothetical protein